MRFGFAFSASSSFIFFSSGADTPEYFDRQLKYEQWPVASCGILMSLSKQFRCLSDTKSFEYSTFDAPALPINQSLASILDPD